MPKFTQGTKRLIVNESRLNIIWLTSKKKKNNKKYEN